MPEPEAHPQPQKRGTGRFWLIVVLLLVVFGILLAVGLVPRLRKGKQRDEAARQERTAKPVVLVAPARRAPDTTALRLPADLRSLHETDVFARVNGFVQSWTTDIGGHVRKGQVLATIATPELDQQIAQAQANLALARSSYGRLVSVSLPGAVSKQEVDAARAQLLAQEAVVKQLEAQRSFRQVRAPFSGVVTQRSVDVGTLVTGGNTNGTQLFKVEDTDTLRAFVDVPQNYVPSIKRGLAADVLIPEFPNKPFRARVSRDAQALDPETRTLRTEVLLPNRRQQVRAGAYAQVRFELPRTAPSVLISANALVPGIEQKVALVQDGKIHFQPITTGRDFGSTVEVTQGLKGGEQVVMNPAEALAEGAAVAARPAPAPPKPAGPPPPKPTPNDPDAPRVSSPLGK